MPFGTVESALNNSILLPILEGGNGAVGTGTILVAGVTNKKIYVTGLMLVASGSGSTIGAFKLYSNTTALTGTMRCGTTAHMWLPGRNYLWTNSGEGLVMDVVTFALAGFLLYTVK